LKRGGESKRKKRKEKKKKKKRKIRIAGEARGVGLCGAKDGKGKSYAGGKAWDGLSSIPV
jgi:hypothetical protein